MYNRRNQRLARKIIKRDGNKCALCGCEHGLEVHHLIPYALGGEDTEDNLLTVCESCHKRITPTVTLERLAASYKEKFKLDFYKALEKKVESGEWGSAMIFDTLEEM